MRSVFIAALTAKNANGTSKATARIRHLRGY